MIQLSLVLSLGEGPLLEISSRGLDTDGDGRLAMDDFKFLEKWQHGIAFSSFFLQLWGVTNKTIVDSWGNEIKSDKKFPVCPKNTSRSKWSLCFFSTSIIHMVHIFWPLGWYLRVLLLILNVLMVYSEHDSEYPTHPLTQAVQPFSSIFQETSGVPHR